MSSDWDEIKRLAADFQKVQLSSTLSKLSEANCIEVVNLLIERELINVVFTVDGKEYITPEHLERELEDELYAHGGCIHLVELAKNLNVDQSRINQLAESIAKEKDDLHLVLGYLLNEDYCRSLAVEINENLSQKGEVSVFELASHYSLPTEFLLQHVMQKYLGTIIHAKQDSEDNMKFFTLKYLARCRAKLKGSLIGLTMPTPVATFFQNIGAQESIYHALISELNPTGVITSKQKGALYIPYVYTKTQSDWVDVFYKQNGYVEYDAVARLGVSAPLNFIKKQLAMQDCTYLKKCCVDQRIIGQIEAALEECIVTGSYLDASTILPSIMSEEDIADIIAVVLKPNKQKSTQLFGTTIFTTQFIEKLMEPCHEICAQNAKQFVENGSYQKFMTDSQGSGGKSLDLDQDSKADKKDERRRKAAGGKGGGGTQGRETKTKSTKKHVRGGGGDKGRHSDSDDDNYSNKKKTNATLELVTVKEIEKAIFKPLDAEGLGDLSDELARQFYPQLSRSAQSIAQSLYEASLKSSTQNRRQVHSNVQDKINDSLVDIRLYEKGIKLFPVTVQPQLVKYLLKSLGNDVCNEIFVYVANECNLSYEGELTTEQRVKIQQECAEEYRSVLAALAKTTSGASIEDFLTAAENALVACSMILKKVDKKKDRTLILVHKHKLLDELTKCQDAALVLHLCVLVIFTVSTQCILHASGKHVSSILSYLQPVLDDKQRTTLMAYHDLVLKMLGSDGDAAKAAANDIDGLTKEVKEIAANYKKAGVTSAE